MSGRPLSAAQSSGHFAASAARLAERRARRRHRRLIAFGILLCTLLGALIGGLWQRSVRISRIEVYGADASLASYAEAAMRGSYLGIIPRDSIFFFPASRIRAAILADHPGTAAVSIFRNGFTGISIKPDERTPIARWCGSADDGATRFNLVDTRLNLVAKNLVANCYVFDASGYIFAAAASSTRTINTFSFYAPLAGGTPEPLRATIANAEKLPALFDFARRLDTFGSPTVSVVIRDDEVDDSVRSGTRITYVLGNEQDAFTALMSARENLNLADGSIEYIDLRFGGKVYLKRKE